MGREHPRQLLLNNPAWQSYCALREFYTTAQLNRLCESAWARASQDARTWEYQEGSQEYALLADDIANKCFPKVYERVVSWFAGNPMGTVPFFVVKSSPPDGKDVEAEGSGDGLS